MWTCEQVRENIRAVTEENENMSEAIRLAWRKLHPDCRDHLLICVNCQKKYKLGGAI